MKHNMNRVLSIVALLLMTIGTWAQSAEDVTIKVTPDGAGTVSKSVDDKGVCTLTVTPVTGYYLTVDNLKAVASLKGEEMQAPKRVSLPLDNNVLEITATNANAEPTGVTTYTFTIPEGCSVEVTAEFRKVYNIPEVNGVSFDVATNTLTLTNATIASGDGWAFEFGPSVTAINVVLEGTNTITGNGFLFAESPAAMTFMTDFVAPGSLTVAGDNSTFVATSVNQGSTTVYCENGLAYDEAGKKVSISENSLTVGGVAVTNLNASRIYGNTITGIVSFDAEKNILTLNNATIDMTQGSAYPIVSAIENLTVHLIGQNTLKTNASATKGFSYNGQGSATLTFTKEETAGSNGYGTLIIAGGDIATGYTIGNTFETTNATGWAKTQNDEGTTVAYVEYYELTIGSTQMNSSMLKMTSENGTAIYQPTNQTLYLNNYTTTDGITTTLSKLTISLTGINSVGAVTGNNAELIVRKNNASNEDYNKLTAISITGFTKTTIEEPLKELSGQSGVVISDLVTYNLWVNGVQVTKENMTAIIPGVSFDGVQTLTLTKVNATSTAASFITNGLSKLTIHLLDENTVDCVNQLFLDKKEDDNDHQVAFTTDQNEAGKLTLNNVGSSWYAGHTEPTYYNKLEPRGEGTISIVAPSDYYGLTIAGVEVTNLNAAKITGDNITAGSVSFDVTANTLTLNGATISGNIVSTREALNIYLIGENVISGLQSENCDLVFVPSSEDGTDKLTMDNDIQITSGNSILYRSMLMKTQEGNKFVIALPDNYGITVNGQLITPKNRLHVLGANDNSVQFDGNNKLILNKASLAGSIELGDMELLPAVGEQKKKVLKIHLDGSTVMTDGTARILKFTGTSANKSDYEVVLDINSNVPGEFVYKFTGSLQNIPKSLGDAFDGISVSKNDKLDVRINPIARTVTVSTALKPIIPGESEDPDSPTENNQEATRDFASSKVSTLTLDNVVVDDILYTLNDSHTKNTNDDGYHDGKVVLNSKVSTSDLEQAMNCTPGTEEFAKYFKGLTFEVPGGSGKIDLTDVFGQPGEVLCVKIGGGDPIKIELTETPSKYTIEYCVAAATYVYVYMQESTSTAPAMLAQRRIGPKSSVAGGLGGISVQSNTIQTGSSAAKTHKSMETSSMASAMSAVTDAHNGYSCNDPDITDLPDNMFLKKSTSTAPSRRGSAVETILPEGLTFVDFSNTKITGMEVSRTSGAFNGVPDNVFIYMPAGNTTKDKNVVIGGICDNLELNGEKNVLPFRAMKSFTASQATLKRTFAAYNDEKKAATIYLPYAIPQDEANKLGKFYEFTGIENDEVQMKQVTTGGLKANKPYIFKAKEGGVTDPMVRVVNVLNNPIETEGFKGVYERKEYEPGMYCYAAEVKGNAAVGQFVEMGPGSYVPPYRAYMMGNGAPVYAIAWDGVVDLQEEETTAIENVKTVTNVKTQEGWWTISGMRLNAQPKKAGMYVFNGRLVVVK